MTTDTASGPADLASFDGADWLPTFERRVHHCAESQLVPPDQVSRLVALGLAMTLTSHQVLSELGHSPRVWRQVKDYLYELKQSIDPDYAEPPSLSEMTIIMDIASTAFSLLDHRRITAGELETDVRIERIASALLPTMRRACEAGGPVAAASLMQFLQTMTCYENAGT